MVPTVVRFVEAEANGIDSPVHVVESVAYIIEPVVYIVELVVYIVELAAYIVESVVYIVEPMLQFVEPAIHDGEAQLGCSTKIGDGIQQLVVLPIVHGSIAAYDCCAGLSWTLLSRATESRRAHLRAAAPLPVGSAPHRPPDPATRQVTRPLGLHVDDGASVNYWAYTAGGALTAEITRGVDRPFGVAISLGKR
jgi:hypothetical protein